MQYSTIHNIDLVVVGFIIIVCAAQRRNNKACVYVCVLVLSTAFERATAIFVCLIFFAFFFDAPQKKKLINTDADRSACPQSFVCLDCSCPHPSWKLRA